MSCVAPNGLVKVVDWTATIDDRHLPTTIGFFVELDGDQGMVPYVYVLPCVSLMKHFGNWHSAALAPERALDELSRSNENIAEAPARDLFRQPTIRIVRSGTFSDFRQLKLDEGGNNLGQIKVPVILLKPAYITWFSDRVVQEL